MKRWEDLGNSRWKLTITPDDPEDTSPPSVFRGTKEEIADLLASSQEHANRRIAELKRADNGHTNGATPPAGPKPLTPAEQLQTVAELNNPATVTRAIVRAVESEMGPIRERQQREDEAAYNREALDAALRFANETPEYYQTQHNANTMMGYLRTRGMDLRHAENYATAFEQLTAAQLLQRRPKEEETNEEPEGAGERNAPAALPAPKAPTRITTGITQRDISGSPPRPTTRLKYSREQLAQMGKQEYKNLMITDRAELERCEAYYAKNQAKRAS